MADAHPTEGREDLGERWSRAVGRPHKVVQIDDPRGIRAIAHKARQQVIQMLFVNTRRSFTATELSDLTGLSPSAMSYHLRALEKWGVIERAPDADGDARNRPWRAAGTQLNITGGDDPGTSAARTLLFDRALADLRRRLEGYQRWPQAAREIFVGSSRAQLWLTPGPDRLALPGGSASRTRAVGGRGRERTESRQDPGGCLLLAAPDRGSRSRPVAGRVLNPDGWLG